jgi:hypothetical protein
MTSSIEARKQEVKKQRSTRVPLGVPRMKLAAPQIPGFKCRWINDEPGRLQNAEQGGYEFVREKELKGEAGNTDLGEKVSRIVGKNDDSSPKRAFLMKIKKSWYDEDQKAKRKPLDEIDKSIRQGKLNEKSDDKRYVPREGISVGSKLEQPEE